MSKKLDNLKGVMSNTRSRNLLIITLVIVIVAIVIGYIGLRETHKTVSSSAALSGVPGIASIPGSDTASVQYVKAVAKSNQQDAQHALKTGSSSIPTILRSASFSKGSFDKAGGGYGGACSSVKSRYPFCFAGNMTGRYGQKELADLLNEIAKACRPGMPLAACQAALEKLEKEGKLSAADAKALLAAYSGTTGASQMVGALLKKGVLSSAEASALDAACKKGHSDAACIAALRRLVAEGKLTPAQARRLLAAFGHKVPPNAFANAAAMHDLIKAKKLSAASANKIMMACKPGMSRRLCAAAIKRLLAEGKISPALAKKLLAQYGAAHLLPASKGLASLGNLVASGKLTPSEAQALENACRKGMPPSVCQAAIARLVREGKLTPAQAARLLKAFGQTGSDASAGNRDLAGLVGSGELSPKEAALVAAACAKGGSSKACEAAIKRLLAEGKLTPEQAEKLLSAYGLGKHSGVTGPAALGDLVSSGQLSPEQARAVQRACKAGAPPQACLAELRRLVAEGKLTPAQARRLLAAFGKSGQLTAGTKKASLTGAPDALNELLNDGKLTPKEASAINAACKKGMSAASCEALLKRLVAEGKLTPAQAQQLLAAYGHAGTKDMAGISAVGNLERSGLLSKAEGESLQAACRPDAPPGSCAAALRKLIAEGKLTPAQAAKLLAAFNKPPVKFSASSADQQGGSGDLAAAPESLGGGSGNNNINQVLARQRAYLANQQHQQKVQALEAAMQSQAGSLFSSWYPLPVQSVTQGIKLTPSASSSKSNNGADSDDGVTPENQQVIKAGTIEFAVLNTAIDSDQPGPIMAKVVGGPFKGSSLLGTMTRENDKLLLRFTVMSIPKSHHSVAINAVAIDPKTARTALASSVNNHYLLRYGTMFASSFLQGMGQAVQQSGQSSVVTTSGTSSSSPTTTTKQKLLIALGQTGAQWSSQLQPISQVPPTVRLYSGTGLGILLLKDLKVSKDWLNKSDEF